jgi:5-methyltetrahydrofolate--homocysteine methyltransferase
VYHGKDAFEGLRVMNALMEGKADELNREIDERLEKRAAVEAKVGAPSGAAGSEGGVALAARSGVATDNALPKAPFWGDRVVEAVSLKEVYAHINKVALYRGQWQFKKGKLSDEAYAAQIEDEVEPIFKRLTERCESEGVLKPRVVYGYWPCNSDGDDLIVFDAEDHGREIERFTFPRQAKKGRLCLSDFFRPIESGERDVIGMSCVTVGAEISKITQALFEGDDYAEYLYLHGLGVESAEGLAEFWHKRMRQELGFSNEDSPNVRDLFTQKYRGSRYSFGYPACPEMSDQEKLFRLLKPERIGCTLTENWQIDPEQSTSAIIVHHPEAKYFNV